MSILYSLIIVAVAALIHASFQLSVSVLTLLSSHTIGAKRSHATLIRLTNSFVLGVGIMTTLLVAFVAQLAVVFSRGDISSLDWTIICGLLFGLGLGVWLFYYRSSKGTTLWVPRNIAQYLTRRSKRTHSSAEAFGLGISSVWAEGLFVALPIIVAGFALVELPNPTWQLLGILLYAVVSLLSLLIVNSLIGSGHQISRIQRWRETNKRFLQFAAGAGLLVLGFYLYVDQVLGVTVMAAAAGGR